VSDFTSRQRLPRIVVDTSVIVAAFRSRHGASRHLLDIFDQGRYHLLLSPALLLEYEAVLTRPNQLEAHGATVEQIAEFLDEVAARCERVIMHFQWRPQLIDPGDEFVLETAINGQADAIVTHNTAHFVEAAARFGIEVFRPGRIIGTEAFR